MVTPTIMGYRHRMGPSSPLVGAPGRSFGVEAHPQVKDRIELTLLAREQAALRRVATLVARGAPPAEVFEAVIAEVGRLAPADAAALSRYETDDTLTVIGGWSRSGGYVPVGTRHPFETGTLGRLVFETRRPGRIDSYADAPGSLAAVVRGLGWRSAVGAPILVEGRLWGVVGVASTTDRPLPLDTEGRLAEFTELLATAISNSQARDELARLAEQQLALRRVATLVARGAPPAEVFEAVIAEVGRLVGADAAGLGRYEPDGTVVPISGWSRTRGSATPAKRYGLGRGILARQVFDTRRPGRIDSYAGVPGTGPAAAARDMGWRSSVGAPIIVEGRLWGVVAVASMTDRPLPLDTEQRLAEFTELVATAIANTESQAELVASRARIAATADATRRRIERDLHDGVQQQLVSLALELRAAQAMVSPELGELRGQLSRVVEGQTSVLDELREMALGIHPGILAEGGLGPALKTLARRSAIPVQLDVRAEGPLPERVEVAAYYIVSEALTNATKYARASRVVVDVKAGQHVLHVTISDDGVGGADPAGGSGLLGLNDRAVAMGGTMSLESPAGGGTSLQVELPVDDLGPPGSVRRPPDAPTDPSLQP
jgi:signal transduction histidine kinase